MHSACWSSSRSTGSSRPAIGTQWTSSSTSKATRPLRASSWLRRQRQLSVAEHRALPLAINSARLLLWRTWTRPARGAEILAQRILVERAFSFARGAGGFEGCVVVDGASSPGRDAGGFEWRVVVDCTPGFARAARRLEGLLVVSRGATAGSRGPTSGLQRCVFVDRVCSFGGGAGGLEGRLLIGSSARLFEPSSRQLVSGIAGNRAEGEAGCGQRNNQCAHGYLLLTLP